MPDRLLSTYQVANLLSVTPGAVVEWIQRGYLPIQELPDGSARISQETALQFLARLQADPAEPPAELPAAQSAPDEQPFTEQDLPRLDPGEYVAVGREGARLEGASRSETIESMFPLDPGLMHEGPSYPVAASPGPELQDATATQEQPFEPDERDELLGEPAPAAQAPQAPAPQEEDVASDDVSCGPATRLVRHALACRADEVHVEDTDQGLSVRLRIDGRLHDAARCDLGLSDPLVAIALQDLRAQAGTAQADTRGPSRGLVELFVDGREVAVTVATCPTAWGHWAVVALRDSRVDPADLSLLALPAQTQARLARVLAGPSGLVLLAARVGPERSFALEALISAIDPSVRSIVMIARNPASVPHGLTPVAIDPAAGFSSAQAVRTAAQQHADAIVVEDVRDTQTVPALLEAVESGRLVVAAIDAPGVTDALATLLEMHLDPLALAVSLKAVVATTRVRRLCPDCRQPARGGDELPAQLGLTWQDVGRAYAPGSCPQCVTSGYRGVSGCSSAVLVDKDLATVIGSDPDRAELAAAVQRAGGRGLLQVGLDMVRQGLTSLEELVRALPPEAERSP